nr:DUF4931 domain-containing protein [Selenomonas ruminantium]
MPYNIIDFDMQIGRQKPETIRHPDNYCPFCHPEDLTDIIAADGPIILLRNKYNVLSGTKQYVLIENDVCNSDIPTYSPSHMQRLLRFGLYHWQKMLTSGQYDDVAFFKNYGPLSGGTIRHPHMQIIAFPKLETPLSIHIEEFTGETITRENGVEFNISTIPRIGFWELNIIPPPGMIEDELTIATMSRFLQIGTHYLTHRFHNGRVESYNIFFYHLQSQVYCKIMPRFATPPLFVGYGVHVRPTNISATIAEIQRIYFAKE